MINVPLVEIPKFEKLNIPQIDDIGFMQYLRLWYQELKENKGYYFPHCETVWPNRDCHYLKEGCTGCLQEGRRDE